MRPGLILMIGGLGFLAACNKDDPAPVPPPPAPVATTYSIGGTVTGLNGSVTLANNGGDARTVNAAGAFSFATPLANGAAYAVTVSTQPANQTCSVTSGSGNVASANVAGVNVTCVTNTFTVGGTVTGLVGGGLVLRNNAGNDLTRDADGAFTFTTAVATGGAYAVTIATQPANQTCTLANESGVIAAANVSNVSVTCATFRVTGVVGPAGGTLTGPDGVEVIIPAGALVQPTTIGIARSPGGWPEPLVADATRFGSIYEFTPHDVIFDKPVLIRLPTPNGVADPYALVSSFNEGWQRTDVGVVGNYAELERNIFSWMYIVGACAPPASDPYPCSLPRGHSFATATPANAISMISGVPQWQGNGFYMQASAGTWAVNSNLLQTLHLTAVYDAAPDCGGGHVQLKRLVPGANPAAQTITDQLVALDPQGNGSTTINIDADDLDDGNNTFTMRFACARPGRSEHGGADWITFQVSANPVPGFEVGGTVTGLTAGGLELQNFNREIISVAAGSTEFAFGTPLNAGANYSVHVRTQPTGQTCAIASASGTVAADVGNIAVTCQGGAQPTPALVLVPGAELNDLTILRRNTDSGRLTVTGTLNTGDYPRAVAVTPDGHFAYVANASGSSISSFRIQGTTVTSIGGSTPTSNPFALVVDPDGDTLRVANYGTHTVSSFRINAQSGVLTGMGTMPVGLYPYAVVTHPSGAFVYVLNEMGSSSSGPSVSAFSVDSSNGSLTSLGQPAASPVPSPHNIAITPNGQFAYVASAFGRVGRLNIDTATGALTPAGSTIINFASDSESLAIHPNGNFLYVTGSASPDGFIQVFSIGSNGALTAVSRETTGRGSNYVAISSDGDFLYVTNSLSDAVVSYSINSTTGALTLLETDTVSIAPQNIALTP